MARVYIVRPGEHCYDAAGNIVSEREFAEDSPIPQLEHNRPLCTLINRPDGAGTAKPTPSFESPRYGEDHED